MVVCIGLVLNGANLLGYVKCKLGRTEAITTTVSNLASSYFQKQIITNVSTLACLLVRGAPNKRGVSGQTKKIIRGS